MEVHQQALAAQLFQLLVEENPIQTARARDFPIAQPAHEQISLPLGQLVARIESESRHRDGGHPVDDRRLEARV